MRHHERQHWQISHIAMYKGFGVIEKNNSVDQSGTRVCLFESAKPVNIYIKDMCIVAKMYICHFLKNQNS